MAVDADDADIEATTELRELSRSGGLLGMHGHGPYPFRNDSCVSDEPSQSRSGAERERVRGVYASHRRTPRANTGVRR
ncbi:hypothetical protein GCM10010324_52420 [Streptomyces hiroshimensis]|uniref:Uncharacterized protein n=1 Tax=Streptomyces hiroshimensis TaxID=66424 RepID=A0ABQ2Z265_9ACTN|nr:hypothetical protein GCM10010324_52420 [Streptomyces hiroshimensis]